VQESRRSSVRADGRCVTPPWHITRCGHRRYQVRPPSKPGFHVALLDSSGKTNRRGRDMDRVDVPGSGVSLSLDSQARTGWPGDGWVKFFRYGAIVVGPRVHPWCGIPFRGHFWWNRRKRRLQALPMQAVLRTPAPPRMSGSPPRQGSAIRSDLLSTCLRAGLRPGFWRSFRRGVGLADLTSACLRAWRLGCLG